MSETPYICFQNQHVPNTLTSMEKLLHYVWKHRILPLKTLHTMDSRQVELLNPGEHNTNQGPDFFNAKVKIGGVVWAGNVEIHLKASDWFAHGHHRDPAYNNTILHVTLDADTQVVTHDGHHPVTIQIDLPRELLQRYKELCQTDDYPRCHRIVPHIHITKVHSWMDALLAERMEERAGHILQRVEMTGGDWERAAFVALSRNFGFGLNGDVYERWAMRVPLYAAAKHRDSVEQITALFLGVAGLLPRVDDGGAAQREYNFLAHKFDLAEPMPASAWKYLRTRPSNFPHVRLSQLARIYVSGQAQFHALLQMTRADQVRHCLHQGNLSPASCNLIVINTVAPLLYAYGMSLHDEDLKERAIALLTQLPAENNFIIRQWQKCGLDVESAADSQALIQLKREYCNRMDCLRCRFGYENLKQQ